MSFTCIRMEGGLLAPDFLETIADAEGQKPGDFGVEGRRTLVDEVSSLWSDVRSYWDAFQRRLQRRSSESLTTITREQWGLPLLEALGYDLTYHPQGVEIEGRNYRISHRTGESEEDLPVHIEPFDQDLGSRPPSGRGVMSPHAMIQDYLNRSEHLWAVLTNGSTLRLLRDCSYFTRPAFVEFDLRQMLEGERLDEFFLFYRLVHRTRLPATMDDGPNCLLERYHQLTIEQGGRIRDGLRGAVEQAIVTLANGFIAHPRNEALREDLRSGRLSPATFYQQLLYLIYRLLFLMVAEERGLLSGADGQDLPAREYFTIGRLRSLADKPLSAPERFSDLYLNLRALFHALCKEEFAAALGLPPLNGELFESARVSALGDAYLNNRDLLAAMRTLSWFIPRDQRVPTRVNYRHLDVEELGSVYESLLDLQPIVAEQDGRLAFHFGAGTERKSTGSYYTRPELVQELIKSALVPVIEDRLAEARRLAKGEWRTDEEARYASEVVSGSGGGEPSPLTTHHSPFTAVPLATRYSLLAERALLSLTVCDPACGSGHFLLAAARRIGTELAKVRTGEEAPPPEDIRRAVRDAITHCIYGVDKNPLAVDLCKVALWIEGHYGGRPLTFLDHRIRCGDSLVGVFDLAVLEEGIPDDAFKPVTGDDKKVASAVRKRNKQERESGQATLPFDVREDMTALLDTRQSLLAIPDDTPQDVRRKREAYERLQQEGTPLWHQQMACHLWTDAFFAELTPEAQEQGLIPTTGDLRRFLQDPASVSGRLIAHVWAMAQRNRFFHWPLEFPEVFEQGGFDCVMGNPPFVDSETLCRTSPHLRSFVERLYDAASGNWDLYIAFVERALRTTRSTGCFGLVTPRTFLASDYSAGIQSICLQLEPVACTDYPDADLFADAAVRVCHLAVRKRAAGPGHSVRYSSFDAALRPKHSATATLAELRSLPPGYIAAPLSVTRPELLRSLTVMGSLGQVSEASDGATTAEAYEIREHVAEASGSEGGLARGRFVRLVNTGTIDPYHLLWGERAIRYLGFTGMEPVVHLDALAGISERRLQQAMAWKVVLAGLAGRIEAAVAPRGVLCGKSAVAVVPSAGVCPYALTAWLNSLPINQLYRAIFGLRGMAEQAMNVGPRQVEQLPVPDRAMLACYWSDSELECPSGVPSDELLRRLSSSLAVLEKDGDTTLSAFGLAMHFASYGYIGPDTEHLLKRVDRFVEGLLVSEAPGS